MRVEMSFLPDVVLAVRRLRAAALRPARRSRCGYKGRTIGRGAAASPSTRPGESSRRSRRSRAPLDRSRRSGSATCSSASRLHTLSGGEAQRLKLAAELGRARARAALYVLDEPTTGLHLRDVARLGTALHGLVDRGDTLVVVEHHLDLIARGRLADRSRPEGGDRGGALVAEGPPEEVARAKGSRTAPYLRETLRSAAPLVREARA